MANQKGFIGILALIVISVAVAGGGYYAYDKQQEKKAASLAVEQQGEVVVNTEQKSVPEEKSTTSVITTEKRIDSTAKIDGVGSINIKTDIKTSVDCGTEDCFETKFASCEPSTMKVEAGFPGGAEYKIIGPTSGGCKMSFKYTSNPNPAWVNQEMTCVYDNKVDFEESFMKTYTAAFEGTIVCEGPLYKILSES